MKRLLFLLLILSAFSLTMSAQEMPITGMVTSQLDNEPMVGVSVVVKGTTQGAITDIDGTYSITVEKGQTLSFSFIGYNAEEIVITDQTTLDVVLIEDLQQLQEVVVTALGIERKERGLTYSTQKVEGDELITAKEVNMINSLAGKTAGITISKSSSGVGGSSRVILRGNKSMNGANQPLYVIDGIPMNNSNLGEPVEFYYAVDNGDAISNINPEDIESINVLRGASAAALYGSQAANGVILITTKKGKAGVSKIQFSSSMAWETPLILPELQGKYGQSEAGVSTSTWGDANNLASNSHVDGYFNTGSTYINSLSVTSGNEKGQFYASFANTNANGIVPENKMNKNNYMLSGSTTVYERLKIDASANLINQEIKDRPYLGTYYNPIISTYLFPESSSQFDYYKDNYQVFDEAQLLNVQNYPYSEVNEVFTLDNPYWITNKLNNKSIRNRVIFNVSAKLELLESLDLIGRVNYDRINDNFEHHIYATTSSIITHPNGDYVNRSQTSGQLYSDVLLSFNDNLGDVSVSATGGFSNSQSKNYSMDISSQATKTGLYLCNYFNINNLRNGFYRMESQTEVLTQAVFATAEVGYKNFVYLNLTGRNEWTSTLDDPYFYPSAGLTFILSELTGTSDIFNYAKIRGSFSKVGNALPFGVSERPPVELAPDGSPITSDVAAIGTLKPEMSKSTEIGADFRLFSNAINLELTYYNNKIDDQFFTIPAPAGFGYLNAYTNGGTIRNSGIEAILTYKYATQDFMYSTSLNFAKNKNEVLKIDERLPNDYFVVTPKDDGRIVEIRVAEGGSYGDFYGTDFQKDAAGDLVLNDEGAPVVIDSLIYLGNPNPDFLLGWSNTFTYKNLSFSFLIDGKFGGEVISITESVLDSYGRSERSGADRDAGEVVYGRQSFDPELWYTSTGGLSGVTSQYIYNATNIRLREVTLGYNIPGLFDNLVKNVKISAYARNLFFLFNEAPFDPESTATTGNGLQGIDMFGMPSTKSFGLNLQVTF